MQQGWVNRLWVNLVSIHGVALVRKYNAFVVENCSKSSTNSWNAD